jgi:hypothetical protein
MCVCRPQVLQYLWDLASLDPEQRATAAEQLVAALVASQAAHKVAEGGGSQQLTMADVAAAMDASSRQQLLNRALSRCSPLMVSPAAAGATHTYTTHTCCKAAAVVGSSCSRTWLYVLPPPLGARGLPP